MIFLKITKDQQIFDNKKYAKVSIKYVNAIVERGDAIATREREKADTMQTMGGVPL
jgi:hypothetical protein